MSAPPTTAELLTEVSLTASPYDRVADAVAAVLDDLAAKGLGRWILSGDEPPQSGRALCLVVSGGPLRRWLSRAEGSRDVLTPEEERVVIAAARLIATLVAHDRQLSALEDRAARAEVESATDALTGVPNARTWWRTVMQESTRCDRFGLPAVIAVVDLNDLKRVNDSAGHLAGDVLLRTAAAALTDVMSGHVVARIGGDEFAVFAVDPSPEFTTALPTLLTDALAAVGASASIGVASYAPGGDIERCFDDADQRMYDAKRAARGAHRRRGRLSGQKFEGKSREKFSKK